MEARARADEEETTEAEALKAVEARVTLADHAAVFPLGPKLKNALTLPRVITLELLMLSLVLLSNRKFTRTRRNMDAIIDVNPDKPRNGGDRTMSELSSVRLMNLEDDLRKISKVTRSTRKRVRATKEDTSRKDILASSNDYDSLKFSKTANHDNRAIGRQPQRVRDWS